MAVDRLTLRKTFDRQNIFARNPAAHIDARVLAAGVAETHTVPTAADIVIFSSDGDFYARPNASAAVPAADVTDGTGSELNPVIWHLSGVTTIGIIAPAAQKVTLSFYKGE